MLRPDLDLPIEEQSEEVLCRVVLADEARGEKDLSGDLDAYPMLAVWCVVRNLARRRKSNMKTEILRPFAFSGFNVKGGHRDKLLRYPDTDLVAWTRADAVCDIAEQLNMRGLLVDPTGGADHYYNPAIVQPAWGRGHPEWVETIVIGSHVFGRCP